MPVEDEPVSDFPYNPYDFANPVSERKLFAGRSSELKDVEYYLDQASAAPRAINIALMGERASGKTSFLNIIEREARKREFLTVRVDLNEADASHPLRLFFKIFDSLLFSACEAGAFGGLQGSTYDTYRDIVDTFEIPADKLFCPFLFPLQYAKSMLRGTGEMLSEALFKRDLIALTEAVEAPCIILFDECDVLGASHVALEQLRNVFMNLPQYMLVFAGTPRLFPMMDEVFSPITRQFKKVEVGSFVRAADTQACIEAPLEDIGTSLDALVGPGSRMLIREVHQVTQGKPYEIQLLCHFMFKRVQVGVAPRMRLTVDVLDDVRRELEAANDLSLRPVTAAIRRLTRDELRALNILGGATEHATLDQLHAAEHTFEDRPSYTKAQLAHEFACLSAAGILGVRQGMITFLGDDFDRVYAKYSARAYRVALNIRSAPLTQHYQQRLNYFALTKLEISWEAMLSEWPSDEANATAVMEQILAGAGNIPTSVVTEVCRGLYWPLFERRNEPSVVISRVHWSTPWGSAELYLVGALQDREAQLQQAAARANEVGCSLEFTQSEYDRSAVVKVLAGIRALPPSEAQRWLGLRHAEEIAANYGGRASVTPESLGIAREHASFAAELRPAHDVYNVMGYLELASGDVGRGARQFEQAIEHAKTPGDRALSLYNLTVALMVMQRLPEAVRRREELREIVEGEGDAAAPDLLCLLFPRLRAGELYLDEQMSPVWTQALINLDAVLAELTRDRLGDP